MSELIVTKAHIKGVDQTPRKVSLVASLVRGRTVADALVILEHTPKRSALVVKKAIASAKANAINNNNVDGKTLVIKTLSITTGPRMKRFKPASRGRALPFVKKSSHILVEVVGTEKAKKKPAVAAEKPVEAKAESKKPAVKAKGEK
ncbi:MAG: 50S ribosomal protein L22 [Candidatus Saccharimonadaceae bacterium]